MKTYRTDKAGQQELQQTIADDMIFFAGDENEVDFTDAIIVAVNSAMQALADNGVVEVGAGYKGLSPTYYAEFLEMLNEVIFIETDNSGINIWCEEKETTND